MQLLHPFMSYAACITGSSEDNRKQEAAADSSNKDIKQTCSKSKTNFQWSKILSSKQPLL